MFPFSSGLSVQAHFLPPFSLVKIRPLRWHPSSFQSGASLFLFERSPSCPYILCAFFGFQIIGNRFQIFTWRRSLQNALSLIHIFARKKGKGVAAQPGGLPAHGKVALRGRYMVAYQKHGYGPFPGARRFGRARRTGPFYHIPRLCAKKARGHLPMGQRYFSRRPAVALRHAAGLFIRPQLV